MPLLDKKSSSPGQPKVLESIIRRVEEACVCVCPACPFLKYRPSKESEFSRIFLFRDLLHIDNSNW